MGEGRINVEGIKCIIGGFWLELFLGCWFLYGNIQVYVTSYLNKQHPGVSLTDTLIVGPLNVISQAIANPIGTYLLQWFSPRTVLTIGWGTALSGVILSSYMTEALPFSLLYGLTYGVGIGIAYLTPLIWGWEHFPNRKGMVSGFIISGFGLGAFLFGYISLAIANPENESPELEVAGGKIFHPQMEQSDRSPTMIRVNATIWACLSIIGIIWVTKPSKHLDQDDGYISLDDYEGSNSIDSHEHLEMNLKSEKKYIDFKEALLKSATWHVCFMVVISSIQGSFINQIFKSYGELKIPDDAFITTVGTVASISNWVSRIFWANMQDKFGFKSMYMWLLSMQILIGTTIGYISSSKVLYLLWINLQYFCIGGYFTLTPTLWAKMYGHQTGGRIYSIMMLFFTIPNLVTYSLTKFLYHLVGYDVIFYITASTSFLSSVMLLFFKEKEYLVKEDSAKQTLLEFSKLH